MRSAPDGWLLVRTADEAKAVLEMGQVDRCSLDHDLGACDECIVAGTHIGDMATSDTTFFHWCPHVPDGTELARWMAETGHWSAEKPMIHSMNIAGRDRMQSLIDRFWGQPAQGPMFYDAKDRK